jgi:hypothetical protein
MGKRRTENQNPVLLSLIDLEKDFFIDDDPFAVDDITEVGRRNETVS